MRFEKKNLTLIDALRERHIKLKKLIEHSWNENNDINLSNSEWCIMSKIYKKQPTIAHVSKNVDISRQATHKLIKQLASKELVKIRDAKDNKKEKRIHLTELGESCYEKNEALKADLEKKIADNIGDEQLQLLENILKSDWGL